MTIGLIDVYHMVLFTMNSRVVCVTYRNSSMDRSNNFEVVSYPTNNFIFCSPLDKNFGVILCRTLRDYHMIQLC